MADARKDKRTLLSLKIRYKSATLEDFIERYSSDISRGGVFIKAKKPLAAAEVVVEDVEGNPGYYSAKFYLRPHYQLEGLSVSLRLVSKLPSVKG